MEGIRLSSGTWDELVVRCRSVRDSVFVVERSVPAALEYAADDSASLHVLASLADGTAVGTGRLMPDGQIGRLAVLRSWRGHGIGGAMLALLIEEARERSLVKVAVDAPVNLLVFFRDFGFGEIGERLVDAGGEHQPLELRL